MTAAPLRARPGRGRDVREAGRDGAPGRRRLGPLLAAGAAALVLVGTAGCTQVAQLRGVAGGEVSAVRTATNDALVTAGVTVGTAPTCSYDDPQYECQGTTADGQPIRSVARVLAEFGATTDQWGAPEPADISLVVTVGGRGTVYEGTVQDMLMRTGQVPR